MASAVRAIAQTLPVLFLCSGCPPVLHVYVTNVSDETLTLGYFDESHELEPGRSQKIVCSINTDGWRVEQGGLVRSYDSRLEIPRQYASPRLLFVVVRIAVDADGRLWLLPPDRDAEPRPVEPQPSGFPIQPS